MVSLVHLSSILKKIKQKGFLWLYARIKNEFVRPTFGVNMYFSGWIEALRKICQWNNRVHQNKIIGEDTLLFIYDLNVVPATFDFAFLLAAAETFGKNHGKTKVFVVFWQKKLEELGDEDYTAIVSQDSQQWRVNNILVQLSQLYPACSGYGFLPSDAKVDNFIQNQLVYPARYSSTFKPYPLNYAEIFKLLDKRLFTGFSASKTGIDYIKKWFRYNNITSPIVVITLRKYGFDETRNSNIAEWIKFAHWVKSEGFTPIFVSDTDSCWTSEKGLDELVVFNEPCWNLGLRMALYEQAFVNFFYSNGTSAIGSLNKKIRLIAMCPVIEDSIHFRSDVVDSFGLDSGQRRYNFAEKHQLLSWKQDMFENIRDDFLAFRGSTPSIENSRNIDTGY